MGGNGKNWDRHNRNNKGKGKSRYHEYEGDDQHYNRGKNHDAIKDKQLKRYRLDLGGIKILGLLNQDQALDVKRKWIHLPTKDRNREEMHKVIKNVCNTLCRQASKELDEWLDEHASDSDSIIMEQIERVAKGQTDQELNAMTPRKFMDRERYGLLNHLKGPELWKKEEDERLKNMHITALEAKCEVQDKRINDLCNMTKHNTASIAHGASEKAAILEEEACKRKRRKFHDEDLKERKVPDDAMANSGSEKAEVPGKKGEIVISKLEEVPPSQAGSEAGEHAGKIIKSDAGSQSDSDSDTHESTLMVCICTREDHTTVLKKKNTILGCTTCKVGWAKTIRQRR
jgi:hypothetical protein